MNQRVGHLAMLDEDGTPMTMKVVVERLEGSMRLYNAETGAQVGRRWGLNTPIYRTANMAIRVAKEMKAP